MKLVFLYASVTMVIGQIQHDFALHKVPISRTTDLMHAATNLAENVTTRDAMDTFFVMDIPIGTPPRVYRMAFDISSQNTQLAYIGCGSDCNGIWRYDKLTSSSYKNVTMSRDGTFYDIVKIGGSSVSNGRIIPVQSNPLSYYDTSYKLEGILSGGFPLNAYNETTSPVVNLLSSQSFNGYTVVIKSIQQNSITENAGSVIFGGFGDSSSCANSRQYINTIYNFAWSIENATFTFGNLSTMEYANVGFTTTSQYITGPVDYVDMMAQIANATQTDDGYLIDCNAQLPSLIVKINRVVQLTIDSSSLVLKKNSTNCMFGIQSTSQSSSWSFGLPVYTQYCITHDIGSTRLGFASKIFPLASLDRQTSCVFSTIFFLLSAYIMI